jgi:hypothetical protein
MIEIKCKFTGMVLFTHASAVDGQRPLRNAVIAAAKARADLTNADLMDADLTNADLSRANLTSADLSRANLTCADLSRANLTCADLSHADLSHANLAGANLASADLVGANLAGADLTGADLSRADLAGADLAGAHLVGVDLTGTNLGTIPWYGNMGAHLHEGIPSGVRHDAAVVPVANDRRRHDMNNDHADLLKRHVAGCLIGWHNGHLKMHRTTVDANVIAWILELERLAGVHQDIARDTRLPKPPVHPEDKAR